MPAAGPQLRNGLRGRQRNDRRFCAQRRFLDAVDSYIPPGYLSANPRSIDAGFGALYVTAESNDAANLHTLLRRSNDGGLSCTTIQTDTVAGSSSTGNGFSARADIGDVYYATSHNAGGERYIARRIRCY